MAISLVIEDGTGLSNANCYISIAQARDYAVNRGFTLSGVNDTVAAQIINATDYLESFRDRYKGERVGITQALSWPRRCAFLYDDVADQNCVEFPFNEIPQVLINAQCQLIIEQNAGTVLQPTNTGKFVTSETVGPITRRYSEIIGTLQRPSMPTVRAIMKPLIVSVGPLRNVRA